jgi:cell division protease FtsH
MERKHHINFWYVIIAFWAVMIIQSYWASYQHTEAIPYSKFEELLKSGAVKDVAVSRDTITGTLKEPAKDQKPHFSTVRIDPSFADTVLLEHETLDQEALKPFALQMKEHDVLPVALPAA